MVTDQALDDVELSTPDPIGPMMSIDQPGRQKTAEIPLLLRKADIRQPHEGMFTILNTATGDDRLVWDAGDLKEINDAHAQFDDLIARGYEAFPVTRGGGKGPTPIKRFDARAEEIIMVQKQLVVGG